jgi:hypothetical protein
VTFTGSYWNAETKALAVEVGILATAGVAAPYLLGGSGAAATAGSVGAGEAAVGGEAATTATAATAIRTLDTPGMIGLIILRCIRERLTVSAS